MSVCRVCLSGGDLRLRTLQNIQLINVYDELSHSQFNSAYPKPRVLCYPCYQKLLHCYTFAETAQRADGILNQLFSNGALEITPDSIAEITLGRKLSFAPSTKFVNSNVEAVYAPTKIVNSNVDAIYHCTTEFNSKSNETNYISTISIKGEPISDNEDTDEFRDDSVDETGSSSLAKDSIDKDAEFDDFSQDAANFVDIEIVRFDEPPEDIKPKEENTLPLDKNKIKSNQNDLKFPSLDNVQRTESKRIESDGTWMNGEVQETIKHTKRRNNKNCPTENGNAVKKRIRKQSSLIYPCTQCSKKFTKKCNLTNHIRTHTGEKPYDCSLCDKSFAHKSNLQDHAKIHSGEKRYACSVCNKQFTRNNGLVRHMITHTGDKPFQCSVCEKRYTDSSNLTAHLRTHLTKHEPLNS